MKLYLHIFLITLSLLSFSSCEKDSSSPSNTSSSPVSSDPANSGVTIPESTGTPLESYTGTVIYRSYSGNDYLYSTSNLEGPQGSYFPDEARFGLVANGTAGTNPLYRCRIKNTNSHFLSLDSLCEGQVVEGNLGSLYTAKSGSLVALNRYVNVSTSNHINILPDDTFNLSGWKFESTLGYVTKIKLPQIVQTTDDGQKYFGYYAGAMDGVGSGDYIPELSGWSNLIFIKSGNFEAKLIECEQRGLKAIITFDWIFFDENFRLKSDYAQSFSAIEPVLRKHISTIAAFYGQDEPYNNGMMHGLTAAEVYNAQETMGRFLKSKFPNIPIGVIHTTIELKNNNPLFPSFDWYGFDCYSSSMSCDGKSVSWYYDELNSRLDTMTFKDNKKRFIISVPQAGYSVKDGSSAGVSSIQVQEPQYVQLVKNNPKVKVVMPFLWQSFNSGADNWVGARDIPQSKSIYQTFFVKFISGTL